MPAVTLRQQQWQQALSMTEDMLQRAQEGDWGALGALEIERRGIIESFFATQVPEQDAPYVADGIRALMALDQQIMALCKVARDDVAHKAGVVSQGRRAEAAYNANR